MKTKSPQQGIVYSTDHGRMCPACGHPIVACCCRRASPPSKGDGIARISRETKGRKGKGVTLISGLSLDEGALRELAGELKRKCGCGGGVKEGVIEIQGDQRHIVVPELVGRGFTVKQSGGGG